MSLNYPAGSAAYGVFPYSAPHGSQQLAQLNALDFWSQSDMQDAGLTINRALAAGASRYPQGFRLYLPTDLYQVGTTIVVPISNVIVYGDGWGSVLSALPGFTGDFITTGVIPAVNAANDMTGIVIEDVRFDGTQALANVAGRGNGVHFWGARQSFVRRCSFTHMKNYAVILEGSTTSGYNDVAQECAIDSTCNGGILIPSQNEADWILNNELIGCAQTLAAAQPAFGSQSASGHCLKADSGICNIYGNIFGGGALSGTMNAALNLNNEGHRVISNRFDATMNIALDIGGSGGLGGMMILANEFKDSNTVVGGPSIRVDAGDITILGNVWVADSGIHYTYCIQESEALAGNKYAYNQFRVPGTAGVIGLNAGSTSVAAHNTGYNPRGHAVTQPAVPATTVAQTNTTGVDCSVYVAGGTVSAIALGGVATGLTSGEFRVPAGQTITLTYTGAPAWVWMGD